MQVLFHELLRPDFCALMFLQHVLMKNLDFYNVSDPQEVSLSLANDKEVVLSIQVGDRNGQVRQDQVNQTNNGQTVANDGDSGKRDSVASSGNLP